MGCIRCGLCQDHCPVGLDPRGLLDLVERRRFDLAARRAPVVCLECGLCDYVCPSALPLMRAVQRSRRHVLAE
jgi:electron transport complex protein RnfC